VSGLCRRALAPCLTQPEASTPVPAALDSLDSRVGECIRVLEFPRVLLPMTWLCVEDVSPFRTRVDAFSRSLSDLGRIGCKRISAGPISPFPWSKVLPWTGESVPIRFCSVAFSLSILQIRQALCHRHAGASHLTIVSRRSTGFINDSCPWS
jgi:hypothetical protein